MNTSALPIIADAIKHALVVAAPSVVAVGLVAGLLWCWMTGGRRHG